MGSSRSLPSCRHVSWRWKLDVVPIIWGGHRRRWSTRLDLCRRSMSDRSVGERTSLTNHIRSLLLECGHVVAQGHARLRFLLGELLDIDAGVQSPRMMFLLGDMRTRWEELDRRIAAFDAELAAVARADARARRLTDIPGIRALNATALIAAVGDAATFAKGRDLAAWLGLLPRQATTGGRPKLLGLTKRGSRYLRKMLIQGAGSAMPSLAKSDTAIGAWLRGLLARSHSNVAVVALAAKMARTVWPCSTTSDATRPCW